MLWLLFDFGKQYVYLCSVYIMYTQFIFMYTCNNIYSDHSCLSPSFLPSLSLLLCADLLYAHVHEYIRLLNGRRLVGQVHRDMRARMAAAPAAVPHEVCCRVSEAPHMEDESRQELGRQEGRAAVQEAQVSPRLAAAVLDRGTQEGLHGTRHGTYICIYWEYIGIFYII